MESTTTVSWAAFLLRLGAATVFLAHSLPKLFPGKAGGKVGRQKITEDIAGLGFPRPELWALAVVLLQAVGGLLLLAGLFTAWLAAALAMVMVVATYAKHREMGFVMGSDFPWALLCMLLALAALGDGRFSLGTVLGW